MNKLEWYLFTSNNKVINKIDLWWTHGWVSTVRAFIHNTFNDPYKKERKCLPRYTWKDRDVVLEDVVFKLFTEFCDSEDENWNRKLTTEDVGNDPYCIESHNKRIDEKQDIYTFIKTLPDHEEVGNMSIEDEDKHNEKITEYLTKIIKLRGGLWT